MTRSAVGRALRSLGATLPLAAVFVIGVGSEVLASEASAPTSRSQTLVQIRDALRVADGHPNEKHRLYALRDYLKGNFVAAAEQFQLAAGFADKYSQHRLSLMYWDGEGVARDRALAYVWSDLAAERGTPRLLAIREKMWAALGAAEQAQAARIGSDYYARFGDSVAKPRQIARMQRFARQRTGSRVGWDGQRLDISVPQSGQIDQVDQSQPLSADTLYGPERTDPKLYWRIQDAILSGGTVEVGDPGRVATDPAPQAP